MDEKESFDRFCQQVGLEKECGQKSWNLWECFSTKVTSETAKSALIPWFVCATYVTICNKKFMNIALQAGENMLPQPSVCELLKVAKMRMVEFFQKMKDFAEICDVGNPVTESLTELKKAFCVSSAMFYKFKRVVPVLVNDQAFSSESDNTKDSFIKTCWLLFIICKGWQPQQISDLMTAFYLLLCCVDFVHKRFLSSTLHSTDLSETNISLEQGILPQLCEETNTPYSLVNEVYLQYFQPFLDSKSHVKELLDIDVLNSCYEEIHCKCKDFDERDFFDEDGYLCTDSNGTLNGGAASISLQKCTYATSITALESKGANPSPANDLETVLDEMSDSPNQELLRFWVCCKRGPQELIQSQLNDVQENFIKGFAEVFNEANSNISNQIFVRAKKLYYRVMEAMLLAEEKRLSCSDFSALLNSRAFHVSLMACSLEVVMAGKVLSRPAVKFPWILSVLGLKAFDFFKVIESFILHEPFLGSNLRKHLNRIEEQVLESLAWTADSPLLTSIEMTADPHVDSSSGSSGHVQQPKKSQPLNLFLRKVNQLAYNRLVSLCSKLDIDDTLRGHMWTCLEHSLRFHWQLMKDRHLDQMMLCAVYAISKVLGKEIQFKQIVTSYKGLPFASGQVYMGIPDKEQDTIIGFYNKVYMVAMKSTILQFAPNKIPPVSPAPKSSVRIPGKKNFYLSPLRNSPSQTLTPRSRSLYSFGDSPGSGDRESLSRINASMQAVVHSQPKVPQKRLRFDDCDVTESPPILTNGNSKDDGSEPEVNGTNGRKEHEAQETEAS